MAVIDLSHTIVSGMPVYPGDPEVTVASALTVTEDGVAVARLEFGSHTGTHLDAPAHSIVGGRTVDRIPLEWLTGEAMVLPVGPTAALASEVLGVERIAQVIPPRLPLIVCIATGWDDRFGEPEGLRHPAVSLELAELLWERGARVLGIDMLSPDLTEPPAGMQVHEYWLGNDGVIVENLARLSELPACVEVAFLPLRIADGDGSPIRAVAFVG